MRRYRYVTLDPTGNITCLVLDPADPADKAELTRKLLEQCEQVAYLTPPSKPGAVAGIRLMGGEFCGNAAMAAAAWLLRGELAQGETKALLLEVSGAADPVRCTVRKTAEGFEGTLEMPGVPEIREETIDGLPFTAVRLEGIVHFVCESRAYKKDEAEELIRRIAGKLPDEAVGLLQWDGAARYLTPLVFVRGSGSLVWEHGCGSGSAAVGAAEALKAGDGTTVTGVNQPGGLIIAAAETEKGRILSVTITGRVRLEKESVIEIS